MIHREQNGIPANLLSCKTQCPNDLEKNEILPKAQNIELNTIRSIQDSTVDHDARFPLWVDVACTFVTYATTKH